MKNLIAALGENIKQTRRNAWSAKCPVHGDKDFAMSIKLNEDNSILAHCHACGANGLELYKSLGLDLHELFGDKQQDGFWIPQRIRDSYEIDKFVLAIAKADTDAGKKINYTDKKRIRLAEARIKGIEAKYPNIKY